MIASHRTARCILYHQRAEIAPHKIVAETDDMLVVQSRQHLRLVIQASLMARRLIFLQTIPSQHFQGHWRMQADMLALPDFDHASLIQHANQLVVPQGLARLQMRAWTYAHVCTLPYEG